MPSNGPKVLAEYSALLDDRSLFEPRWETLAAFVAPSRVGITTKRSPGQQQNKEVYDSTHMFAADILASFIAGNTTNPGEKWFSLKMRDEEVNAQDDVREWLDAVRDKILAELSSSNFYAEIQETYIDWAGFGTGSLFTHEASQPVNRTIAGFRGLHFQSIKIGRYVIREGPDGKIDTFIYEYDRSADLLVAEFGEDKVPDEVRKAAANDKTKHQKFCIVHAIFPRPLSEQNGDRADGMPWASVYVEKKSKKIVKESGFSTFPFSVPRWHKSQNEAYGRGRGELALPDTKTLNTSKKLGLEDHALKVRPPIFARHDSVLGGTIRLRPAGFNSLKVDSGRPISDAIMPYQTGSHPEVTQIKEEELRKTIREIYYVDQVLQMLQVDKTQMTAYEFDKKLKLLYKLMATVYGRMESELLNPLIDRIFNLMFEMGSFPPPPDAIYQSDGLFDIQFTGPLAVAQQSGDIDAMTLAMQDIAPVYSIDPTVVDNFDMDMYARKVAEYRRVPATVVRSEEERDQLRQQRAEQQQKEADQNDALAISQVAKNAAPAMKVLQGGAGQGKSA